MKALTRWTVAFAVICGVGLSGAVNGADPTDPAWTPACEEVAAIQVGNAKAPGSLRAFCLNAEGNILACVAPNPRGINTSTDAGNVSGIRVYSPEGKLLKSLPLEIKPNAICVGEDGVIFVGGDGRVLKLDAEGKVLASAPSPVAGESVGITKESENSIAGAARQTNRSVEDTRKEYRGMVENRRGEVYALTVTGQDLYMVVPAPNESSSQVYRLDQATLANPRLVVQKLRNCGQMNIDAHDGKVLVAHGARHSVEIYDRDGKALSKFGTSGRVKAADFGGCCEPKNVCVLPNGDVLAAESGPPLCIKRFSPTGKFIEVVAVVNNPKVGCDRVPIEASPDERRFYMLDITKDAIRVFAAKS
jgi:hypothetical protein